MTRSRDASESPSTQGEVQAITWAAGGVRILDQTRLPQETAFLTVHDYRDVVEAIRSLRVRGAPAIGVAGAYALALEARRGASRDREEVLARLEAAAAEVRRARPTAVNLAWAVDRVMGACRHERTADAVRRRAVAEAQAIHREDAGMNRRIGALGAALVPPESRVLTHCNTGALATGGWGTALGVIRAAWREGRVREVFATESRPLLQGARLTAWELVQEGIPVTLIVDSAAGALLRTGVMACVIVGADRVAANGDVANKIGTYTLAVLAREHGVPLYVAAPTSTLDLATPSGDAIPIEERGWQEVFEVGQSAVAPAGARAWNPAFDVTPAHLVTAIITERGVVYPPYAEGLPALTREAMQVLGKARTQGAAP